MNDFPPKKKLLRAFLVLSPILLVLILYLAGRSDRGTPREKTPEPVHVIEDQGEKIVCRTQTDTLRRGESIYLSLRRHRVLNGQIHELVSVLGPVFNLKRSHPGDTYSLACDSAGTIQRFEYHPNMEEVVVVERKAGRLTALKEKIPLDQDVRSVSAEITSSLYEALIDRGERPELVYAFSDIFGWDIDFSVDPRKGDRIALIFETYRKDGAFVKYGRILAAGYRSRKKIYKAVFYEDAAGHADYYTPDGKSVRKMFLKSPLHYRRISSRFSYHRFHPVLRRYLPHLGVDYAAARGTPVQATADGVVLFSARKGPNGKMVKIKHGNRYTTYYLHLSRYGRGIRKGAHVKQGQIIGYVGSTGRSTGPHLDYRFKKDGRFLDPLRVSVPAAAPVKSACKRDFEQKRDDLFQMLDPLIGLGEPLATKTIDAPTESAHMATGASEPKGISGLFKRIFE
ncbi:MAG: M23 family metallopeptidase [Candidatus Latescibacteria bacterium]|nr:M23 family metallopeptidase [Candidatus Latescibacterota bacterium]